MWNAKPPDGFLLSVENAKEAEQECRTQHVHEALVQMECPEEEGGNDDGNKGGIAFRHDPFQKSERSLYESRQGAFL